MLVWHIKTKIVWSESTSRWGQRVYPIPSVPRTNNRKDEFTSEQNDNNSFLSLASGKGGVDITIYFFPNTSEYSKHRSDFNTCDEFSIKMNSNNINSFIDGIGLDFNSLLISKINQAQDSKKIVRNIINALKKNKC